MTKRDRDFDIEEVQPLLKKTKREQDTDVPGVKDSIPVLPREILSSIFEYLPVEEVLNKLRLLNTETNQLIIGNGGPQLDFNDYFQWLPKTITPQRMVFTRYLAQVATAQFEEIQIIQKEWKEAIHWVAISAEEKKEIFKISSPASSFLEIQHRETLLDNLHLKVIGQMIRIEASENLRLDHRALTRLPEKLFKEKNYKEYFSQIRELNLCYNHLKKLPKQFCECKNLQILNLSHNQFSAFPESICGLENLDRLYMESNQLSIMPEEINHLNSLMLLNLEKNQLSDLPIQENSLPDLEALYLDKNNFKSLPDSLCYLTKLQTLTLNDNHISELNGSIKSLTELRRLELCGNQLTVLPKEMKSLKNLEILSIKNNLFEEWPEVLNDLENILTLQIGYNQLQNLNLDPNKLKNLVRLNLEFNRLKSMPDTLLALDALDYVGLSGNQLSKNTLFRLAEHFELGEKWVEETFQSQTHISTEPESQSVKRWRPWE